eukprot:5341531-Pleurochrysis_carterae.AAC.1
MQHECMHATCRIVLNFPQCLRASSPRACRDSHVSIHVVARARPRAHACARTRLLTRACTRTHTRDWDAACNGVRYWPSRMRIERIQWLDLKTGTRSYPLMCSLAYVFFDDERARAQGVATTDVGVAKDGSPKDTFERGMELHAKARQRKAFGRSLAQRTRSKSIEGS